MKFLDPLLKILKITKMQFLALAVLIFTLFIFGDNSIKMRLKYDRQITELKNEIKHYNKKIESEKEKLHELHSDKENLEKYARENYLMKNKNEEIFIIE